MNNADSHDTKLRVATYNIRKCVGLDWRRNPDRIMHVLSEIEADVVMLQEADKRFGSRAGTLSSDILRHQTGLTLIRSGNGVPGHGHFGNALLIGEKAEVLSLQQLTLPCLEPRGAIMAELSKDGRKIRIVGTHFGLRARDRQRQSVALLDAFHSCDENMPEVIVGDFNEWSDKDINLSPLHERFQIADTSASFHTAAPVAALDRILVGSGLEIIATGVHRSAMARTASDHFPVWADLRFRQTMKST
jgi:endonuclease/exonuclease/phosphatase family metal-dependent hydrolase